MLLLNYISFDRLWAVSAPFHHRVTAAKKKVGVSITICWILPIFISAGFAADTLLRKIRIEEMYDDLNANYGIVNAMTVIVAHIIFLISYSSIVAIRPL